MKDEWGLGIDLRSLRQGLGFGELEAVYPEGVVYHSPGSANEVSATLGIEQKSQEPRRGSINLELNLINPSGIKEIGSHRVEKPFLEKK